MFTARMVSGFILLSTLLTNTAAHTQPQLPVPQASPAASVTQTIGTTEVKLVYHRPGVKGRNIWGVVVPYNEVWRAGANENTTISFSDPVRINGNDLTSGTYGLHMIPTEKDWTVIFTKNSTSWGSFFYDQNEDALRVTATPQHNDHTEWLEYTFDDLSRSSATITLRWEKVSISFKVEVDVNRVVLDYARNTFLRGLAGFQWQGFNQAANYALQNNVDLEQALSWADQSISLNQNFTNLRTKAGILEKVGRTAEAEELRERSLTMATETDINNLGYQYLSQNEVRKAIDVFKKNVKDYPESWNVYDSLGEAYEKDGQIRPAVENYSKALSMVRDEANRKRITTILERLKSTMQ